MDVVEWVLAVLNEGKPAVVADDEDRESEGDLIGVADTVKPHMIDDTITHGRGLAYFPIITTGPYLQLKEQVTIPCFLNLQNG